MWTSVRVFVLAVLVGLITCPAAAPAADCRFSAADCTLRETADQAGVGIGAAVGPTQLQNDAEYGPALALDFNSLTAENVMKWNALQPTLGVYTFGPADQLVTFAQANGMAVRGHNLIWEQVLIDSTPAYVTDITDEQELRDLMTDHIQTVVGHFAGDVDAWDVVNEPLETGGTAVHDNVFRQLLGPGYIAEALQIAHAADPSAKLFINEVGVSKAGPKFDALLALATDLLNQGAPLHGVGIQGHIFFSPPNVVELQANIEALAALGLIVELTEVDVPVRGPGDLASKLEVQRLEYEGLVSACMAVPACTRVTTWGFTDKYTWIDSFFGPGMAPLPLDENYARKPAYFGVRDGLLSRLGEPVPLLTGAWLVVAAMMLAATLAIWALMLRPVRHRT